MRFPLPLLVLCMIPLALSANESSAQSREDKSDFPAFAHRTLDNIGSRLGQTALVDLDGDGDLDYMAGESTSQSGRIWWWENRGAEPWIRHELGIGDTDVGACVLDVNGDGQPDVVAGKILLINTGAPRSEPFRSFKVGTIEAHDMVAVDINGDGKLDVLANSDKIGLFWYDIPADPTTNWTAHRIASAEDHKIHGGVSPHPTGDINGNGHMDVVTAQAWYENVDGAGTVWKQHKNIPFGEKHQYGIAVKTWVVDLNGDGHADVIQAEADHPDGRIAWFENSGNGLEWIMHVIKDKGDQQDFHSLVVADFNQNGKLDIFSGGGPLSKGDRKNYIWENLAEPGQRPTSERWREHIILQNQPCHEAIAGDVDGDGDIDIVSKPWSAGDEHYILLNQRVDNLP